MIKPLHDAIRDSARDPEERHREHSSTLARSARALSAFSGALLLASGMQRREIGGIARSLLGALLMTHGLTGARPVSWLRWRAAGGPHEAQERPFPRQLVQLQRSLTIQRSADDLYAFWRNLENLPAVMPHLRSVTMLDSSRSRWVARGPFGRPVEWEARIVRDEPGRQLAWRSVEGSETIHSGIVRFIGAPAGRGTEVHVSWHYAPPAGRVGEGVARLLHNVPVQQLAEDLRRFKQIMEAGEIATTRGQPTSSAERLR